LLNISFDLFSAIPLSVVTNRAGRQRIASETKQVTYEHQAIGKRFGFSIANLYQDQYLRPSDSLR